MPDENEHQTGEQPLAGGTPSQEPQLPLDTGESPPADEGEAAPKSMDELLGSLSEAQQRIIKAELNKKNNEAKNLRDRLKAAEPKAAEHDKALEAQKTAEQKAQDAAQAAQERADALLVRAVRGEIKALAAENFADPDDPAGFLELARYVSKDGDIDTDAIRADLDDLLTRKPHLGKPDAKPRPPAPNRAQGSSGNGTPEPQVAPGMARLRAAYASK